MTYMWANEPRDSITRRVRIYRLQRTNTSGFYNSWTLYTTVETAEEAREFCIAIMMEPTAVLAYEPSDGQEQYRLEEWLTRRLATINSEVVTPESPEYTREFTGRFADPREQRQQVPRIRWDYHLTQHGTWVAASEGDAVHFRGYYPPTDEEQERMDSTRRTILEQRARTHSPLDYSRDQARLINEYNTLQSESRGLRGRSFFDTIVDEVAVSPMDNFMRPFVDRLADVVAQQFNNETNPSSVGEEGDTMQAEKVAPSGANKPLVDKGKIMASLIGVRLTNDDITHMNTLQSQSEINQYIIAKKGAPRSPKQLTEEQRKLIARAYSVENSPEYKAKVKSLVSTNVNIEGLNRSLSEQYTKLYRLQDEIDNMLANMTMNKDLTKEVETLLADGYWDLMEIDDEAITFSTDKVYCQHPDIKPMNVLMGTFMVSFYWHDGSVDVHPLADNLVIDGYRHPHVNGSGSVCWGTGRDAYEAARKTAKLSTIFKIVRSILSDYNPGSPYRKLIQFDLLRNKTKYESMKKVFQPARDTKPLAWVIGKYSDEYIEHKVLPSHGDTYKYQIFARYYEGTDQRCDENIYIKDASHMDGWRPITRSAIAQWSDT